MRAPKYLPPPSQMVNIVVGVAVGVADSLLAQAGTVVTSKLTSGEMASMLQVLEICLQGLVSKEELMCWCCHIDIIYFLERPSFTEDDLCQLTDMVTKWKEQMYCIYHTLMLEGVKQDSKMRI